MPAGIDWCWHPDLLAWQLASPGIIAPESGQKLGEGVALWHDCPDRALILRQSPNPDAADLARYGLIFEVTGFAGSYLSLSVDLPEAALRGLSVSHILRLDLGVLLDQPIRAYARLNVSHGPNIEELLRELPLGETGHAGSISIEFDLADTEMNENRLGKIWLDLIFENPRMTTIDLREIVMSRYLRADF